MSVSVAVSTYPSNFQSNMCQVPRLRSLVAAVGKAIATTAVSTTGTPSLIFGPAERCPNASNCFAITSIEFKV